MSGNFLLDTNIVIALFRKDVVVENHINAADNVFVPSIVLGELYFGARNSSRVAHGIAEVDRFAAKNTLLNCDIDTARQFGIIKAQLKIKGRPIPENDIWIAAVAIQHGLVLATRDAHFREVDDLDYEVW